MNTETILYIAIAWIFLVDLIFRITEIKLINKRLLLLEENSLIESETSDAFSVRLEELEKLVESQQPPTEQHNPFHAEGSDYSPFFKGDNHTEQPEVKADPLETYYPLWVHSNEFERLLAIQGLPEIKYWFKDKEVTFEQLKDILGALNGKDEPRTFVNLYADSLVRRSIGSNFNSYEDAYSKRDKYPNYLETVEIIRHKKA